MKDPTLFQANKHLLTTDLFQEYQWLYRLILEVDSQEGLTFRGVAQRVEIEQVKLLQQLKKSAFNENRVPHLIRQLKKECLSDNLYGVSQETLKRLADGEDPDEILRDIQNVSFTLATSESGGNHEAGEGIDGWFERKLEIMNDNSLAYGLLTGISSLDALTTGWHRKDFSVVGGWTSMGKTAFVLEIVKRLNAANYKCAVFSLEMIIDQIYDRLTSNILQVNLQQFRLGKLAPHHYTDRANRTKEQLRTIFIDDTRGVSADYITDVMRRLKRTQGLDFVVVDYIQDVKETGEMNDNGGSALARVCRKLRAAAKEMDCHVMGLSQVTRGVNDRQDKRPLVSDLAGSTGIETSADVIALLYRDDYYNKDSDKKGILEVNFAKQRNGSLGVVELLYDRSTQSIRELAV